MQCQSPPDPTDDEVVSRLLDKAARHVCQATGFSQADFDDVRQELVATVLAARRHFDPKRGAWRALAKTTLTRAAAGLVRARQSHSQRWRNNIGLAKEPTKLPSESLAADVTNIIASLAPAVRQFAVLLMYMPLTEIWRQHCSRRKSEQYLKAIRSAFVRAGFGDDRAGVRSK